MLQLNKIAAERARTMVAQNFQDPSSLDDLAVLDMQLEKQLAAIDGQLNSAVQGKLDSLKRAVDLMDESVSKLTKISTNITNIDEKIARTNTQISNFQYLKKAHNARDNLMKVINQVNFFAEVPTKVAALQQQLEDNPGSLKEVFLESVKLDSLRASLIKEMDFAHRNRRKSVTAMSAEYDDTNTQQKVLDHLKHVPALVSLVQRSIYANILTMFDLADSRPEDLVATFEVIEMQQEYNNRRNQAIAMRQTTHSTGEIQVHPSVINDIQTRMKQLLDNMVEDEFGNWQQYEEESAQHGLKPQSAANGLRIVGSRLLQRMEECQNTVLPCIPRHYDMLYLFVESLEKRLVPALRDLCSGEKLQRLNVSDILDMISWFEYLSSSIVNFGFPDRPSLAKYASMREDLLFEYKERIKKQVHTWFDNIKARELEITQHVKDGTLMTSQPEDMFNIIHAQVAVAREKLPLDYVHEVAIACLQVLQAMQRQEVESLTSKFHSREIDPETLCALVNDNENMYEKCREFSDSVTRILKDREEEQKILVDIAEEVAYQYSRIATTAVETLGRCILDVLDEEVFAQKLFALEWEETGSSLHSNHSYHNSNNHASANPSELMSTITATLDDYCTDLSRWLSYYHYSKLMRFLLSLVVARYVMSIRRKVDANGSFVFRNEMRASNVIVQDHKVLREYFEKHLEVLRHGGLRPAAPSASNTTANGAAGTTSKGTTAATTTAGATATGENADAATLELLIQDMEPIHQLSVVISCSKLANAEACARAFFRKYGLDGMKVIQACFLCNPQLSKADKLVVCENVQKLFDAGIEMHKYVTKCSEYYAGYDVGIDAIVLSKAAQEAVNKPKTGGFGGFFARRR